MIFCTLFNSDYLDKAIALYESLERLDEDFEIYMFVFDDEAEHILLDIGFKNAIILSYKCLMNEMLEEIKTERNIAEFCWTCTPLVIEYVLMNYNEKECTYIDADTYFLSSPRKIYDEIIGSGCSVSIVEHRFALDGNYWGVAGQSGIYNVAFNTFFNDEAGIRVLQEWKEDCMQCCVVIPENGFFGDQKFLDDWTERYDCVHVVQHQGCDVAPWNLGTYLDIRKKKGKVYLTDRYGNESELIMYHFHNIKYMPHNKIYMSLYEYSGVDSKLYSPFSRLRRNKINYIYKPYLRHIRKIRTMLYDKYSMDFERTMLDERAAKKLLPSFDKNFPEWLYARNNVIAMRY